MISSHTSPTPAGAVAPAGTSALRPHLWIGLFLLASIAVCWAPLRQMVALSLADARYSHLILIPLISGFFFHRQRAAIFDGAAPAPRLGGTLLAIAAVIYAAVSLAPPSPDYALTVRMTAVILLWVAGFALCYGPRATRLALFPLAMLLLMVPLPFNLMDWIVSTLQRGSADVTYAFFNLFNVPVFREGVRFELPIVGIEVAKECSSIHSGWALFVTGLILAHLFLKSVPGKTVLVLLTVPIAMFTNAVRIVTLWTLATKVDMGFLTGRLHHDGGILFSLVSLSVLMGLLFLFRKLELR